MHVTFRRILIFSIFVFQLVFGQNLPVVYLKNSYNEYFFGEPCVKDNCDASTEICVNIFFIRQMQFLYPRCLKIFNSNKRKKLKLCFNNLDCEENEFCGGGTQPFFLPLEKNSNTSSEHDNKLGGVCHQGPRTCGETPSKRCYRSIDCKPHIVISEELRPFHKLKNLQCMKHLNNDTDMGFCCEPSNTKSGKDKINEYFNQNSQNFENDDDLFCPDGSTIRENEIKCLDDKCPAFMNAICIKGRCCPNNTRMVGGYRMGYLGYFSNAECDPTRAIRIEYAVCMRVVEWNTYMIYRLGQIHFKHEWLKINDPCVINSDCGVSELCAHSLNDKRFCMRSPVDSIFYDKVNWNHYQPVSMKIAVLIILLIVTIIWTVVFTFLTRE